MEQSSGWNSFASLAFVTKPAMYLKIASLENGWKLSTLLKNSTCPHHLLEQLGRQPDPTNPSHLCRDQHGATCIAGTPACRVCQHWSQKITVRIKWMYRAPAESFTEKWNKLATSVEFRSHTFLFIFIFYYWSHATLQASIICKSFWIM